MNNLITKSLLVVVLSSGAFADSCTYNYNQMNSYVKQFKKAHKLNMSNKMKERLLIILINYTDNAVLNCNDSGRRFKRAFEIKGKLDNYRDGL